MSIPLDPNWSPFAHRLHRWMRSQGLAPGSYGVGVSGGRDSVLLLHLLKELASASGVVPQVIHIHHGGQAVGSRDASEACARQWSERLGCPFHLIRSEVELRSEEEGRTFRRASFMRILREHELKGVFLAHHRDDLLETRLLRLLRGVGAQGLQSMIGQDSRFLRPFLGVSREDISREVHARGLVFVEDETNHSVNYERNWIRQVWLPQLEQHKPGSVNNLARSLELLSETVQTSLARWPSDLFVNKGCVSRPVYQVLSRFEQRQCLATVLRGLEKKDYSQGQIEEIQKQLDKSISEHSFQIAGCLWRVDVRQIEAIKVEIRG